MAGPGQELAMLMLSHFLSSFFNHAAQRFSPPFMSFFSGFSLKSMIRGAFQILKLLNINLFISINQPLLPVD
jgi:hypothetical protein